MRSEFNSSIQKCDQFCDKIWFAGSRGKLLLVRTAMASCKPWAGLKQRSKFEWA